MTAPTAAQWLGMLLVTEAARPREHAAWPAICWVVRNRVATPRRFRSTVEGCILQPKQFSRFNDWEEQLAEGGPDAVWDAACAWAVGKLVTNNISLIMIMISHNPYFRVG